MVLSKGIKSEIYSHYDTVNMLLKPVSFGYDIADTNLLFEKARIMIIIWSEDVGTNGEDILTYNQFVIEVSMLNIHSIVDSFFSYFDK